jgi:hypothetical protein
MRTGSLAYMLRQALKKMPKAGGRGPKEGRIPKLQLLRDVLAEIFRNKKIERFIAGLLFRPSGFIPRTIT